MVVMAIDYGDARTGVAVSDPMGMIVGYTTVVAEWNQDKAAEKVAQIVRERKPDRLVMGFPRNMDGTEGPRAEKYRAFAELLSEKAGMEVILWDERRTTIEAHNILSANGKKTKKHKKNVDAVAASLILEGYLRFLG
ncbi:MAG: Holliday junction resolvase RuvX [Oscillospiraceae bacterium]|nr:Holliday junction resolvase RuvX [Oscillospiraceae bacterium]